MSTQPTPTPTPNDVFAAGWVNALTAWAKQHNDDAVAAYKSAVESAASHNTALAPPQPIVPPVLWVVNAALVYAVYNGTDPNVDDLNNVFQLVQYVAPPPAAEPPTPLVIDLEVPGPIPGTFEATGDGPQYPAGDSVIQDGHRYTKIQVGTSPMSPYPGKAVFAWQQVS